MKTTNLVQYICSYNRGERKSFDFRRLQDAISSDLEDAGSMKLLGYCTGFPLLGVIWAATSNVASKRLEASETGHEKQQLDLEVSWCGLGLMFV